MLGLLRSSDSAMSDPNSPSHSPEQAPPSAPKPQPSPLNGGKRRRRKLHPHEIEKQRKLLIRRITGVMVPILVVVLGLLALWNWQQRRGQDQALRRAQAADEAAARAAQPAQATPAEAADPEAPAADRMLFTAADVAEAFSRQGPERAYEMLLQMEQHRPLTGIELQMMIDLAQNSGRITTARRYVDAAMAEDPTQPDTLALLARQEAFEGNLDEAVARLGEALGQFAGSWVTDQSILLRTAADVAKRLLAARRFDEVADIVPEDAALRSRELYMARLHGLTGAGQRPRILALIDRDPGFLRATERDRIRSANYWHLGRRQDALDAFDRALGYALDERHARELLALGYLARDFRDDARSLKAWDAFLGLPRGQESATLQVWKDILGAALRTKRTSRALEIAETMAVRFPNDIVAQQQQAWLRFLTRTRMRASIEQMERLNADAQVPLEIMLTLALGYAQQGQPARGLLLIDQAPIAWERLPPTFLASYVAVLRANDRTEEADRLAATLRPEDLLPEELALIR